MIAFWFYLFYRSVSGIGAALVLPHLQLWLKETQHTKPILVFSSSHTLFLPSLPLSLHFSCPTRHDPMCRLQGGVVKVWAWCAEWRWCTDGDVLPLQPRRCRETEKKERERKSSRKGLQKRNKKNQNICSLLWEFSSLVETFPSCLQPRSLLFIPPPLSPSLSLHPPAYPPSALPLNTPLQTGLSLWGALSFPLGWPGSFQGTLMDANAGLFQIVLQPEPLICQQASLHGLPVLRKCKSPPYRHL